MQKIKQRNTEEMWLYGKIIRENDIKDHIAAFLNDIVSRMGIQFHEPESIIISQNTPKEENNFMFFVERGGC